jgi:hypothetical protein
VVLGENGRDLRCLRLSCASVGRAFAAGLWQADRAAFARGAVAELRVVS